MHSRLSNASGCLASLAWIFTGSKCHLCGRRFWRGKVRWVPGEGWKERCRKC